MSVPALTVSRLDAAALRVTTPCGAGLMVWRAWGRGRPLLLLHGATGSWTHWIRNVAVLAERFRVLAPDLPGHGDSDPPPDPPTADTVADVVSAGLDLVVPPPDVVELAGFSFGGIIGGLVAARRPARIRTLVLLGSNGMGLPRGHLPPLRRLPPGLSDEAERVVHRENLGAVMFADPGRIDDLAIHVQTENARRARFRSTGIPESDVLLRALPAVRARLAAVWGGRDAFTVPYLAERRKTLGAFQPDLDFRVIPEAGHWTPYEAADTVNEALVEILAR